MNTNTVSRPRLVSAAIAVVIAVVGMSSAIPASAAIGATLNGAVSCDAATGHQIVTWTFTNPYPGPVDIQSAVVDATALTAGSTIDTTATIAPTPVAAQGGTATGQTAASSDAVGSYQLTVGFAQFDLSPQTVVGVVTLPGGCNAPTTTTTTTTIAATTTTQVATTAPTTTASGSGAGLPATGASSLLEVLAGGLLLCGALLLAVRRRPSID